MNVDCAQCDNRLTYIAPRDYRNTPNAVRALFANTGAYPRMITQGRSSLYEPENNAEFPPFETVGSIPEAPIETYGYWESTLPLMNEAGLSIGESSCGTKIVGTADSLLDITELLRIVAERCATALCAVETIGSLSEEYGFMAMKNEITPGTEADGKMAYDDAGEAVIFSDESGEVWVLHITGGFEGVSKSTWAAQRVPKGHVTVLANTFTIRDLPVEPNNDFKFNRNIRAAARAAGLWQGSDTDPIDFTETFGMDIVSFQRKVGELPIPLYTSLRTWRVYDLVAPSLKLPVSVDNNMYPFSVKPDSPVSHRDIFRILGDYYQGSEFDMTEGILAGPFGSPYRHEGGTAKGFAQTQRAISIPRTSYSILGQSKKGRSVAWFAVDQPMTSVFVPLLAKVKSTDGIDPSYTQGTLLEFDRNSAFWAFDFVSNWMNLNWRNMSSEEVYPLQTEIQNRIDVSLESLMRDGESVDDPTVAAWQRGVQRDTVQQWWRLADRIVVKYNDGYYTRVGKDVAEPIVGKSYGLPDWYYRMIGQTADVHPVWVQPWTGNVQPSVNKKIITDTQSLPKDFYESHHKYQVPNSFDLGTMQWVTVPIEEAAGSSPPQASSVVTIAALIFGLGVGLFLGRRSAAVPHKKDQLLG